MDILSQVKTISKRLRNRLTSFILSSLTWNVTRVARLHSHSSRETRVSLWPLMRLQSLSRERTIPSSLKFGVHSRKSWKTKSRSSTFKSNTRQCTPNLTVNFFYFRSYLWSCDSAKHLAAEYLFNYCTWCADGWQTGGVEIPWPRQISCIARFMISLGIILIHKVAFWRVWGWLRTI